MAISKPAQGSTSWYSNYTSIIDAVNAASSLATAAPPSGFYFYPVGQGISTTNTLTTSTLYLTPWDLPVGVTLTRLGTDVAIIGDTGSKLRLGIYADNGSYYPGALILDAGQLLGDSATVQELTISQALAAGTYWIGAVSQSVTTTAPTIRVTSSYSPRLPLGSSATLPAAAGTASSYIQTGVTGALPGTFTATMAVSGRAPRLIAKAA